MNRDELKLIIKESLIKEGFLDVVSTILSPGAAAERSARNVAKSGKLKKIYEKYTNHIIQNYVDVYKNIDKTLLNVYKNSRNLKLTYSKPEYFINDFKNKFPYYNSSVDLSKISDSKKKKLANDILVFFQI